MPEQQLFAYRSPWGGISLLLEGGVCCGIRLVPCDAPACSAMHPVSLWLDAYFSGHPLPPRPLLAKAATPFQHRLRKALLNIPPGETCTYGELAGILNTAPRALGQALGANPLPILVPCHRVVAARGLGGFGCGLAWKKRLLELEGATAPESP
ncbi:MAG: methylated-DNA--[protein]-cysteine S-methyltransferase [Mariprofundaceae bacterium]|nr:methylated-DNA--[protein]-cysteine S-methyltransferase [Mariprofundaceae bacterium]